MRIKILAALFSVFFAFPIQAAQFYAASSCQRTSCVFVQFDPSLGTLVSATYQYGSSVGPAGHLLNFGDGPVTIRAKITGSANPFLLGFPFPEIPLGSSPIFANLEYTFPTGPTALPFYYPTNGSRYITGSNLESLIGHSSIQYGIRSYFDVQFSYVSGTHDYSIVTHEDLNLPNAIGSLLYRYNEFGAVPEPGTWAMFMIGFAFVGCASRSRSRRQLEFWGVSAA